MAENTPDDGKRPSYYVTTPIYYVNAAPHLGTAYSTILADVQARFRRAMGYDVMFLTGLDEHGEKVAASAAEHDMTPQQWCDSQVPAFDDLWKTLEITNDDFIRTTEPRQTASVQHLWEVLKERGYIYKGSYDGWYCVPEETYFTETQVAHSDEANHTEGAHLCPDCGRPLERVQEESWFFKLSEFQKPLLDLYRDHPEFVEPEIRRNEVVSFVEGGLKDLSISRTSFDWGIPLPFDERHVTYVWFDALINYLTAVGYGDDSPEAAATLARRWPAQTHIVGKDIIRFHCVIWPAMLMAAGLPVPERVFVHGFLMVRNEETGAGEKMSKSRGNAIAPAEVIDMLGVEGYRYYFMTDVEPGTDGAVSFSRMEQVYNTDLANSWGNLVSRTLNMSAKFFEGKTPVLPEGWTTAASPLRDAADGLLDRYAADMADFAYGKAAEEVMALVHAANHHIEDTEPWALAKDPVRADELACVIGDLLESIRICAHLLEPFTPETSAEVLRRISCEGEIGSTDLATACEWGAIPQDVPVTKGDALFPRLGTPGK
ncbi:MAG: methionine--tRNA ligase [Atopobiaceae bacterium]|jgi:methionyl-tRNA synthetase|nr:methionine--tRNA ligase [Atopobiaceae bacterium]MCI2174003.1 methionine--tRNA ligase [Atopobiaceae bacterium]MCI2207907.1 methionine--tRNA ligase [Atopobiaceae bacterium]